MRLTEGRAYRYKKGFLYLKPGQFGKSDIRYTRIGPLSVREGGAAQRSPLSVRVVTRLAGGAPPTSFLLPSATHTRPGGADSLSLSQRISETQSFPFSAVSDENLFIAFRGQQYSCPRSSTCERDKAQQEEQENFFYVPSGRGVRSWASGLPACLAQHPRPEVPSYS